MPTPPPQLLADVYWRLPFLVVNLTTDGIVLHCNPETTRITGYEESQLVGKNFWAMLFPGRLFAQIPKFISPTAPSPLLKDTPLTLRTAKGELRILGFTRFIHTASSAADASDSAARTLVCIGVDLTDRLLASDKPDQLDSDCPPAPPIPFGPHIGNGGAIEGEFVTPLAITPPSFRPAHADTPSTDTNAEAVRQVHEFLTEMDLRMGALQVAHAQGELDQLANIASSLSSGAHACGLLEFSAHAHRLHLAASTSQMEPINALIHEILALYRPDRR